VRGDAGGGDTADFFMDYINAEGQPAEMCGNGIRCLAVYAYERDLTAKQELVVDTRAGLKRLRLDVADGRVRSVTVDMGPPTLERGKIPMRGGDPSAHVVAEPLDAGGRTWRASAVSMGNPHCVLFLDPGDDLGTTDVRGVGSVIEHLPLFPNRTNVEFVKVPEPSRVQMRVWERGVGETLACGTGACAALVASAIAGRTARAADVEVPGGVLRVEWREEDGHVHLTGPATFVFDADLSDEWARAAGLSGIPTAAAS